MLTWAALAPSPKQRRNRLLTVRRFALAMHAENPRHQVSAADALGHAVAKRRSPYIYSVDEIARFLRAAAALEPAGSIRPTFYGTLFGPARRDRHADRGSLHLDDVISDGLVIRETKFQKSRLLPPHTTAGQALDGYLAARQSLTTRIARCSYRVPAEHHPTSLWEGFSCSSSIVRLRRVTPSRRIGRSWLSRVSSSASPR